MLAGGACAQRAGVSLAVPAAEAEEGRSGGERKEELEEERGKNGEAGEKEVMVMGIEKERMGVWIGVAYSKANDGAEEEDRGKI